jgi:hypothetical protein
MSEKSTERPWNPSCPCCRALTSRCNAQRVRHWGTWPSMVRPSLSLLRQVLMLSSREQSLHRWPRWATALDSTDDVAKRRGPMQRCWLHHKFGNARRQQGKDSPIRGLESAYEIGQIKRHASAAKRDRRVAQHDTLGRVSSLFHRQHPR